jgi:formyl-CoA transferase
MVCPGNDRLWRKFAEALGHPEWPDDPRFRANPERMRHRDLLLGMIADIMNQQTRAHWSARLDELGVPNGPLNTVPEVMALSQVAALAMFSRPFADLPTLFHGLPISFDGERAGDESRAPRIGEDNGRA